MPKFNRIDLIDSIRRLSISIGRVFGHVPKDVIDFERKREFVRAYIEGDIAKKLPAKSFIHEGVIQYGYLKGIRFENLVNLQAGIAQKLLGVYEVELTDALSKLINRKYDWIVNIGAAEGLYSIKFSREWLGIPVYSFEQDFSTRQLLRELIGLNKASNVVPLGEFKLEYMRQLNDGKKGLIFSDCEGFEAELFSSNMMQFIQNHDLVIETHDHLAAETHDMVKKTLVESHQVTEVDQITLEQRSDRIANESFKSLDAHVKLSILDENRHPSNRWLIALSQSGREV